MRVLIFYPAVYPPRGYGGSARVAWWLARALARMGHQPILPSLVPVTSDLAAGVSAQGIELWELPNSNPSGWSIRAYSKPIDLIHFFAPPEAGLEGALGIPCLTTVHGNGEPGEVFPASSVFLSQDHARRHGSECFVYNGVDPEEVSFNPKVRPKTLAFLGKTSWSVKNVSGAFRMARAASLPIRIAGGNRPWRVRAQCRIQGWRDHGQTAWLGTVSGPSKADLLSQSGALLFPILWEEPFGLVVIEALLSGTPVFAYARGSIPELIGERVGRTARSERELVEAVRAWASGTLNFDPAECRAWAIERFSAERMAREYVALYDRIRRGEALAQSAPHTLPVTPSWKGSPAL